MYEGASVYDSGGKMIGKVSTFVNHDYLLVKKKGVLTNEEFRVPVSNISHFYSSNDDVSIGLKIDQSRLKHGSEVISGASGGSIPSTHEPDLVPTSKEVIRYTVNESEFNNKKGSDLDTDITSSSKYRKDRMPQNTLFACDMCAGKRCVNCDCLIGWWDIRTRKIMPLKREWSQKEHLALR
ncbi:MAG TPA: hypothetical protein VE544_11900 [Nitrososphaeraceae archaeon]|nr:hypothetical protein [Nitrososphaeraceae archaeon]